MSGTTTHERAFADAILGVDVAAIASAEDPLMVAGLRSLASDTPVATWEARLRLLLPLLDGADRLRRVAIREECIRELRQAGVKSPARVVDAALPPAPKEPRAAGVGRGVELEDADPWPVGVEGAALLDDIVAVLNKYIVLPSGAAVAIALWIAHTYLMDVWSVTPLLALSSPTKRCGKTTLLRIIEKLVRRALAASGVSAAAIYRIVEEHEPTLLIDEMDSMRDNEDLRGVLNSGHTRDLAFIIRCVGEGANVEPRRFSTWCPKALAHIGRLPGTLEDRAIRVPMRRKLSGERRERIRRRQLEALLLPIRRRLVRWTQDVVEDIGAREPEVPEVLDDRAADNWEPLLAIADRAGGRWPQAARDVAASFSSDRAQDEAEDNPGVLLLADLHGLLHDGGPLAGEDLIAADTACEELRKVPERSWATWGKGRDGLQPVHLARLLKPFDVVPKPVRIGGRGGVRRYRTEALSDAFNRYLSPPAVAPATPATRENPQHANPYSSTSVAGVAGVAGREGCCGSDANTDGAEVAGDQAADSDVYRHRGKAYRVGDTLPDGRRVESVEDGIPVLVRPKHSEAGAPREEMDL